MSDITVDQKLEALKEIRSTYNKNQFDLSKRERILYGKTSARVYMDNSYQSMATEQFPVTTNYSISGNDTSEEKSNPFLWLRFILAIALMIGMILIDQNGHDIAGVTSDQIFQAISHDYTDFIEAWIRK